jgi:hypothetical protein
MSAAAPVRAWPAPPRAGAARATPSRSTSSRPAPTRASLAVVPRSATAGRLPFVVAVGAVLAAGLVSLLLLHTLAAQDAFTLHALARSSATLADQEQALALANQQAQAPTRLAEQARTLGMVPATSIAVTRLHGRPVAVLRAPNVVVPSAQPTPTTPTTTTAAGSTTKPAVTPARSPVTGTKPTPAATATPRRPAHH